MKRCSQRNFGFSLIELLVYIGIFGMVLSALIPFAWSVIQAGEKNMVIEEVNTNARYISERIKLEIRNSTGINSATGSSLSLSTSTPLTNPTVIDLSAGNIRITQGANPAAVLNSSNSAISSLNFVSYSSGDNKTKNVQFSFTLTGNFPSARQEYQNSTTIQGDAEVRSN